MNYTKPEVKTLGEAKMVIEGTIQKGPVGVIETPTGNWRIIPAYDLDE
jgi:hypothetical protein